MATFAHLIQSVSSLPADASALQSAISALERDIKTLESSSLPWEQTLPWFTALVAFGVAMELWVIWREHCDEMAAWRRGIVRPPDRPSIKKFIVEIVSVLFITGGIVGELWAGVEITSINGSLRSKGAELRSKSDQLLALVTRQAGDAKQSAQTARGEAEAVSKAADAIEKRLNIASAQMGNLEEDIAVQGPRWRLLERAKPELIKQLEPFAGQKLDPFVCGTYESALSNIEMMTVSDKVAEILGSKGAGWIVFPPTLWSDRFPCSEGIQVYVNSRAPKGTMKAARVLSDGLAKTLPIPAMARPWPPAAANKVLTIVDPDWALSQVKRGFESENAPWIRPAKNPELITVFIKMHPQTAPSRHETRK